MEARREGRSLRRGPARQPRRADAVPRDEVAGMNIIETMNDPVLFEPWFRGPSWDAWRTVLKGTLALPMSEAERATFHTLAGRDPPAQPARFF